jgi:hypothetical protein
MMKRIRFGFFVVTAAFAQHAFAAPISAPSPIPSSIPSAMPSPAPSMVSQAANIIEASDDESENELQDLIKSDSTSTAPSESDSEACIINKADPYDVGPVMLKGPYKDQCIDISIKRPAVILSEDDSKITIANFYHAGAYWIAEMPKAGIDQVIFQIASFPDSVPLISFAHTQLRFVMKEGMSVKLTPQDSASKLAATEITEFSFVDQVSGPKGEDDFDASKGLGPAYGNILRVMASEDRAKEELGGYDKKTGKSTDLTRQYLLKMTDDEKIAAMINGVHLSAKLGYTDIYQLFKDNCTTTAFTILDESVKYSHHVGEFKIHPWNVLNPIAGPSLSALKKRKLIDRELETWNEETGLR